MISMAMQKDKGDIVERVGAWMHEAPGVLVQRNARLPILGGRGTREIDVLLATTVSGHQIHMAIECKNEKERIGSPRIDAFRGKLEAVGIPPALGIYVSASGYTKGATEAARAAGIRALRLEGLSADRLSLEVSAALQSIVVLLPDVIRVWMMTDPVGSSIQDMGDAMLFYDAEGEPAGTVPDFVWEAWQNGRLEPRIGPTVLPLEVPAGWYHLVAGEKRFLQAAKVVVDVLGLVLTDEGEAYEPRLVSALGDNFEQSRLSLRFKPLSGRYRLETFRKEEDLAGFLTSRGLIHVVRRIRSPRIRFWNMMFWPPSQRVADTIAAQMQSFDEGRIPDPRPFSFQQIEGSDLGAAWEPIAHDYLAGIQRQEEERPWQSA